MDATFLHGRRSGLRLRYICTVDNKQTRALRIDEKKQTGHEGWNTGGHTVFATGNSMYVGIIGDAGAELHKI